MHVATHVLPSVAKAVGELMVWMMVLSKRRCVSRRHEVKQCEYYVLLAR
jgi:hypothetical protein